MHAVKSFWLLVIVTPLTFTAFAQEDLAKRMEDAIALMRSSGQAQPQVLVPMLTSCAEGYIQKKDFRTALARVEEALALALEHDIDPMSTFFTTSKILNTVDDELATQFLQKQLEAPNASNQYKKGVLKALDLHLALNGDQKLAIQAGYQLWSITKEESPGTEEEFWAKFKFGNHCLTGKLFDVAMPTLKEARTMALEMQRPDLAAHCSRAFGFALAAEGEYEQALELFEEVAVFTQGSQNQEAMLGFELGNVATVQLQLDQLDAAEATITKMQSLARNEIEEGISASMLAALELKRVLAKAGRRNPDLSDAIVAQEKAVAAKLKNDVAGEAIALLGATQDHVALAAMRLMANDLYGAEAALKMATKGADAWEANSREAQKSAVFSADRVNLSMADLRSAIYEFQQQIEVRRKDVVQALVTAENGRGAAQAELLKEKLGIPPSDRVVKEFTPQNIGQVAKDHRTTLVVYSVVHALAPDTRRFFTPEDRLQHPQQLLTWVVKPDGKLTFQATELNGPISTLVELARAQITAPEDKKPKGDPLRDLSKLLIDPIRKQLPDQENSLVTFIPQGELFLVPFAALPDRKGETLIDRYVVGMSPSIELINLAAIQKQAVAKAGNKEILIVGNPKMPGYKSRPDREAHALSPLPGAEREAKFLANALSVEPLIGDAATEVEVASRMGSARFLHFATHGLLEAGNAYNQPFLSALAFAAGDGEDGFLTVKETSRMKLHAELAVLSACDTGVGRISGDGVIGLSRGYITAGVPTVVVSLWPVNDQATAILMANYYKAMMADSLPKAAALRQAILEVKDRYPDPKLWAPFVLYGLAY